MGSANRIVDQGGRALALAAFTITTAGTALSTPLTALPGIKSLAVQATFVRTSGGTKATAYLQTTLDSGATWIDVACMTFTTATATKIFKLDHFVPVPAWYTPTDGSLTDDTILDGLLGDQWRVKLVTTGTYVGTTLTLTALAKG